MAEINLRTGAWQSERILKLRFPEEWQVTVRWPRTPQPLTDAEIEESLTRPIGRLPLQNLLRGKSRPLIIVDDVNRPTPVSRLLPFIWRHLEAAGIPISHSSILMAGGSHGPPSPRAVQNKVGAGTHEACPVLIHDPEHNLVNIGRTSGGTPVYVNRAVIAADVIFGIGGIYPNQSGGFGGGTKLALGVLGLRTIAHLHFGHRPAGWGNLHETNLFRRELDEISRMIGLETTITLHCDANLNPIRIACGDPLVYYAEELAFAQRTFATCGSGDADIVISNTYPMDLSLTFARKKGFHPFSDCKPGASKIAIAACSEGLGLHRLYPITGSPILNHLKAAILKVSVKGPLRLARKRMSRISTWRKPEKPANQNPTWVYLTEANWIPKPVSDLRFHSTWDGVIESVRAEQISKSLTKVVVYPCAPLQFLGPSLKYDAC